MTTPSTYTCVSGSRSPAASPPTSGKAGNAESRPYFTPALNFTVGFVTSASTIAAPIVNAATDANNVGIDIAAPTDTACPASQFPILIDRNQIPIMNPAARSGASFVVALNPTGLRQSSPSVCRKYVPTNHH